MLKFNIVFILVSSLMLMVAGGTIISHTEVKFRLFVHADFSGPDANSYKVAQSSITPNSSTSFGLVTVGDGEITSGPDMNTGKLGRAQGFLVNSGLIKLMILNVANFVFTEGKYKGSTLTLVGPFQPETPIVGGTGIFRLARGYALSRIYFNDSVTGSVTNVYDINVRMN